MTAILSRLSSKFLDKIETEGLLGTAWHVCSAGARRTAELPVRLRREYDIRFSLPVRLEGIQYSLTRDPAPFFSRVRELTLCYVASNQCTEIDSGAYSFKPGGIPILYASCCAALTKHLYTGLADLSASERLTWARYIQGFQSSDGLFRDPAINIPIAEQMDWWGWRHLTLHVLMALTALGAVAELPFSILEPFRKKGFIADWLSTRNWLSDPTSVSNEIQNYATLLQYSRDFLGQAWCSDVLQDMFNWLDKKQDSETGLWGNRFDNPVYLSSGVQTGYHLWVLYFYDGRHLRYPEKIIDSCLKTQNLYGGFGVWLNSSACEDIDSIDPLVRLSFETEYRKDDVLNALTKALPWLLVNMNDDGGWVFRRYQPFQMVHSAMLAKREESSVFYTWFRTLTFAYLTQALAGTCMPRLEWHFLKGPGHQFWTGE